MSWHLLSWSAFGAANVSFCEARLDAPIAEPANAWSSVTYAAAGAWLLWRAASRREGPIALAGVTGLLVGAGSFALHATATFLGQFLDEASMFLLSTLALTLGLRRLLAWDPGRCARVFTGVAAASVALLATVHRSGIPLFGVEMVAAVAVELALWRRGEDGVRYGAMALTLATFGAAFGIWVLDLTRVVCSTEGAHVLNGHAVWHTMSALSLFTYGRFQEQFFASPGAARSRRVRPLRPLHPEAAPSPLPIVALHV
jgi:hypothetical protein